MPKFETFNDGVVHIHAADDKDRINEEIEKYNFGERVIGIKRYYSSNAVNVNISRLVRIPQQREIDTSMIAKIGGNEYKIVQVQHINDTNPKTTDLSLSLKRKKGENG